LENIISENLESIYQSTVAKYKKIELVQVFDIIEIEPSSENYNCSVYQDIEFSVDEDPGYYCRIFDKESKFLKLAIPMALSGLMVISQFQGSLRKGIENKSFRYSKFLVEPVQ